MSNFIHYLQDTPMRDYPWWGIILLVLFFVALLTATFFFAEWVSFPRRRR